MERGVKLAERELIRRRVTGLFKIRISVPVVKSIK